MPLPTGYRWFQHWGSVVHKVDRLTVDIPVYSEGRENAVHEEEVPHKRPPASAEYSHHHHHSVIQLNSTDFSVVFLS